MQELPKFLLADNSSYNYHFYVIHTEYPRFILNVINDNIHWLEEFDKEDKHLLESESESLIKSAFDFYDSEINSIDK